MTPPAVSAIRQALLSVSDRTDLADFARSLVGRGVRLVASSGTLAHLAASGVEAAPMDALTGSGEVLGGRVKTLSRRLHAAILARRDSPEDMDTLARLGVGPVDLVVVNFYPPGSGVESIDVGGPAMARAAAKNHRWVGAVTDPAQYCRVADEIEASGGLSDGTRLDLAREAFRLTAAYDAEIAASLGGRVALRYGENPHQEGALEVGAESPRLLAGKPLSFNNLLDADTALAAVVEHGRPAAAVVKHAVPCGVAIADDPRTAFLGAWDTDPEAAFGGVVAVNRPLDRVLAEAIATGGDRFIEVLVVPAAEESAVALLAGGVRGGRNLRVLLAPGREVRTLDRRRTAWGYLVQTADRVRPDEMPGRSVGPRPPTALESADMDLAWRVARHVRSNAAVLVAGMATVGIGGGQPSRVGAVQIATTKAGPRARGAVLASDGFFPFADSVEEAARAGVTAIVEPGGSVRDGEVIAAATAAGMALVFTGVRHFKH